SFNTRAAPPARVPYENETLSTCSNADSHNAAAAERRKSERLFVCTIRKIQHARVKIESAGDVDACACIDDGVTGRKEQPARAAVVRLDIEDFRPRCDVAECGEPRSRIREMGCTLMTRPPDQRVADVEWRWREAGEAVDRENRRIEERVRASERQPGGDLRVARELEASRARVRGVVAHVTPRVVQRSAG